MIGVGTAECYFFSGGDRESSSTQGLSKCSVSHRSPRVGEGRGEQAWESCRLLGPYPRPENQHVQLTL